MTSLLSRADVENARHTIAPYLSPTPLRRAFSVPGGQAWLKLECWQPTGSFKVRGALNVLAALAPAERARGIVAASAGNHALGVAFAVQALAGGVPTTVFVPNSAPRAKVDKLRTFPITVVEGGATYDEAAMRAAEMGADVYLIEETDWIGGQITSQGVSTPDEATLNIAEAPRVTEPTYGLDASLTTPAAMHAADPPPADVHAATTDIKAP